MTLGIPLLALAVLLLQSVLIDGLLPSLVLLHAGYWLWAALLIVLGRMLADTFGLSSLADALAIGLAFGTLAGAGIAMLQWLGVAHAYPFVLASPGHGIFGNIGQPNHHAHYSWLGVVSLAYLRGRGQLSSAPFWLAIVLLVLGSILGGSRSVYLYALLVAALFTWAARCTPTPEARRLRNALLLLLPLTMAMGILVAWITPWLVEFRPPGGTSGERLFSQVAGASMRLAMAQTAWSAFLGAPWLGHGAGSFPWASFQVAAAQHAQDNLVVAEHAHNVFLHLLVEYGALVASGLALLLVAWFRKIVFHTWSLAQLWGLAILGIGFVHALLEYPQWYAYFLGPAALLLGAMDQGSALQVQGRRFSLYLCIFSLVGAAALWNLRQDYARIETVVYRPLSLHTERDASWNLAMKSLLQLHRESLLSPWALQALAMTAEPDSKLAAERIAICERAIRFTPARKLLARCATQHAIAGNKVEAERMLSATLRAFPTEKSLTVRDLEYWVQEFPEARPLLALSRAS